MHVGGRCGSERLCEEALPQQHLPGKGFSTRHVAVPLHPATADGDEPSRGNSLLHACEQCGVVLPQPRKLLGLGRSERKGEAWETRHVVQHGAP